MERSPNGRQLEKSIKAQLGQGAAIGSILQLSRATGIRPNTMYEWFTGQRTPRTDSLARVAAALEVPLSRLLDAYEGRPTITVDDAALEAIQRAVEQGVEAAIRRLRDEGVIAGPAGRDM